MARQHICDVPGCDNARLRWQRLCTSCFSQLPGDIRTGISEHHRHHRRREHRAECKRAREHLDRTAARMAAHHPVSSQQAFDNTQRLLGEH